MRDPYEICRTCAHAVRADNLPEDLYLCPALLAPLREYADSDAPALVIVSGASPGCADHYEEHPAEFARVWAYELAAEQTAEEKEPLMFWGYRHGG